MYSIVCILYTVYTVHGVYHFQRSRITSSNFPRVSDSLNDGAGTGGSFYIITMQFCSLTGTLSLSTVGPGKPG
jgi:hypothetical protein